MSTEEPPSGTWVDSQDEPGNSFRVREVKLAVLDGPDAGQSKVFGKTPIVLGRNGGDLALTDSRCRRRPGFVESISRQLFCRLQEE